MWTRRKSNPRPELLLTQRLRYLARVTSTIACKVGWQSPPAYLYYPSHPIREVREWRSREGRCKALWGECCLDCVYERECESFDNSVLPLVKSCGDSVTHYERSSTVEAWLAHVAEWLAGGSVGLRAALQTKFECIGEVANPFLGLTPPVNHPVQRRREEWGNVFLD